ncbi:Cytosolic Fe-S cluster assembly factor nar1 [Coniochaeta pulveracea]|uniref:Nuclear architecture-related protein 1 n=1 Tax=Coniochaeta pulveracea TaxID=177199 RepID=A0A420YDZ9_9PEZI|nr:Cytosolic Fe-S cluster assembly factor nar1 [Coniochaeta pulveracea]
MSAILSADDLNDFISPGVACIKPIETLPAAPAPIDEPLETEVIIDGQQKSGSTADAGPAQISLTDCLACSGVEGLEDPSRKLFIASVAPQVRANLAAAVWRGCTEAQAGRMIEQLFLGEKGLRMGGKWNNGFTWVVDTNTAREACLVMGSDEVLGESSMATMDNKPTRPTLTSSCPGWVCYAEKTHPHVLPHLSRVKSPQALMGTLLKTTLSRILGISPDRIWHLAVMPCFDKKLEASREELTDAVWGGDIKPGRGVRDVDCVITGKEVLMLCESRGINFFDMAAGPNPVQPRFPDVTIHNFIFPRKSKHNFSPVAGPSGGNLYFILQDVKSRNPGSQIQTIRGRNVDVVEYTVTSAAGDVIFKAARYYGFRNIQNLVRRLKPAKPSRMPGGRPFGSARKPTGKPAGLEYGYVEVMACPGGCTNGGGQVKVDDPIVIDRQGLAPNPGPEEQKAWLAQVDEAYFSAEDDSAEVGNGEAEAKDGVDGISPSYIHDTLEHWAEVTGVPLDRLVYTSYREVISDVGKDKTTDTERVVQLAGKIGGGW